MVMNSMVNANEEEEEEEEEERRNVLSMRSLVSMLFIPSCMAERRQDIFFFSLDLHESK